MYFVNKLLPILLVIVLSGCGFSFVNVNGDHDLQKLLDARNECASELGGTFSCGALNNCLRTKGWLRIESRDGVVVPPKYLMSCS